MLDFNLNLFHFAIIFINSTLFLYLLKDLQLIGNDFTFPPLRTFSSRRLMSRKVWKVLKPKDCVVQIQTIKPEKEKVILGKYLRNPFCNPFCEPCCDLSFIGNCRSDYVDITRMKSNNCHTLYVKYDPFKW